MVNNKINKSRIQAITIQYDMLLKYCHTCKLQGHEEVGCRSLHPKLKKKKLEENIAKEALAKDINSKAPVQKRFINGKIVFSKWNPTNRRFRDEKRNPMEEAQGETSNQAKRVSSKNPFDVLQGEEDPNKEKIEEAIHGVTNNKHQTVKQSTSSNNKLKMQHDGQGEEGHNTNDTNASEVNNVVTSTFPTKADELNKDENATETTIVMYDKKVQRKLDSN